MAKKKAMSFKDFMRKAKQASKQEMAWGIACLVGCVGLAIWFIVSVLLV